MRRRGLAEHSRVYDAAAAGVDRIEATTTAHEIVAVGIRTQGPNEHPALLLAPLLYVLAPLRAL